MTFLITYGIIASNLVSPLMVDFYLKWPIIGPKIRSKAVTKFDVVVYNVKNCESVKFNVQIRSFTVIWPNSSHFILNKNRLPAWSRFCKINLVSLTRFLIFSNLNRSLNRSSSNDLKPKKKVNFIITQSSSYSSPLSIQITLFFLNLLS